jgi:uncharacterized protein (DUF1501 family)
MNTPPLPPVPGVPTVTRRQLLAMLGVGGTAAATGLLGACSLDSEARAANRASTQKTSAQKTSAQKTSAQKTSARKTSAQGTGGPGSRVLVVLELRGGNDGFATLVPYGDGRFRRLRDRIWVEPRELAVLDDRYAIAKGLGPLEDRLAFVEGVGVARPDLSHFAMMQRWWQGDPDGTANRATGFLGRCCDAVAAGEPVTGISVGGGSSPAMIADKASTVAVPQLDGIREIARAEPNEQRLRAVLSSFPDTAEDRSLGLGDEPDRLLGIAREGLGGGLDVLSTFNRLGDRPQGYPDTELGTSLGIVRQLISMDSGVRVFHIPWGSFDTHTGQVGAHQEQMGQLGAALGAFLDDVDRAGLSDRVLVATTSEFGRRPEANGGGTDHGTASTMLLAGAVEPGRHGQPPDFGRLDATGNVRATVNLADYYATRASWLGAPPPEVLGAGAVVIPGLTRN